MLGNKLLLAAGNVGAGGTGGGYYGPWGWYGNSMVTNPSIVVNDSTADLYLNGGYRQSAYIAQNGLGYYWKRGWTGGNLTSTVYGSMGSSGQGLGLPINEPIFIGSTVVSLETNYWTGGGATLRSWRHVVRNLLDGTISINYIKPYYNQDWRNISSTTYYSEYGRLAKDTSDNYIVPFYHGQNTVEGYDSSHTKQWTRQYNSIPVSIAETAFSGNLIPCVSYYYLSPFFLNATTGATTGQQNTITVNGSTFIPQPRRALGYDSSGNVAFVVGPGYYNGAWNNVVIRYNMSTGALLQKTSIRTPSGNNPSMFGKMDSSGNSYLVHSYESSTYESSQLTPEYGPKIIKIDSSGNVVWERVITAGSTTSHQPSVYGFDLSPDESTFFISVNGLRDSSNTSQNWIFAFPTDGTATQLTDGTVTVNFKALADGVSRFSVTASDSSISTTSSYIPISTTGTTSYSPYTAGVAAISDADQYLGQTTIS